MFMAQTLEKIFLQKVSQMPNDECEVVESSLKEPLKVRKTNTGMFLRFRHVFISWVRWVLTSCFPTIAPNV